MHALHRHIAFGQRQQLPADEDDHRRHALCLELVANAILAWNTRYLTAAIDDARAAEPGLVSDDALAQLSPVGHAHVNPNGRYRFDTTGTPAEGRMRPLRERAASDEQPVGPTQPIPLNGDNIKRRDPCLGVPRAPHRARSPSSARPLDRWLCVRVSRPGAWAQARHRARPRPLGRVRGS